MSRVPRWAWIALAALAVLLVVGKLAGKCVLCQRRERG